MKLYKTTIATLLGLTLCNANADEIQLSNGDRITGKIIRKTDDTLFFNTSFAGEIEVKWSEVRSLKSDTPVSVQLADDALLKGTLVSSEKDNTLKLDKDRYYKTEAISLDKVTFIGPPDENPNAPKYTGIINLGATKNTGNTDNQSIHLDTKFVARTETNRLTLTGIYNRAEDEGVRNVDNALGSVDYDHFLTDRWYAYANALVERDKFQDLKARSILGGGLGYQFFETEISNLSFEAGPSYVNEDFFTADDTDYIAARWALDYDRWLFTKTAQFFHFHEGLVPFDDTSDVYIRSRTGVRVPLVNRFSVTAEVDVDYDAKPVLGNDKIDTVYLLSLGYNF